MVKVCEIQGLETGETPWQTRTTSLTATTANPAA